VEAELEELTEPANPNEIAPYTRSLTEQVYAVRRVVQGTLDSAKIVVLQWSILDGREVAESLEEGSLVTLHLEPLSAHPELEGEHRSADHEAFDLPVFLDVQK